MYKARVVILAKKSRTKKKEESLLNGKGAGIGINEDLLSNVHLSAALGVKEVRSCGLLLRLSGVGFRERGIRECVDFHIPD